MARKREERATRSAQRAARKARSGQNGTDSNYVSLKQQLFAMGLTLREIPGDGNCLFRALGDQLDGTPNTHQKHRQDVVAYMRQHRSDFEPFVEDDVPFDRHLSNLAELGTYGGNDCIVAFARLHQVIVVIHQLNAPLWQICGLEGKKNLRELHISYHNGDHYNSVRRFGDCTTSPVSIKLAVQESSESTTKDASQAESTTTKDSPGSLSDNYNKGFSSSDYSWSAKDYDYSEPVYEGLSKAEQLVMEQTGCEDLSLIRLHLEAQDYDVHETVDAIINFIVLQHKGDYPQTTSTSGDGLWSPNGTGTRLFGESAAAPSPTSVHPSYQRKTSQEKLQRLRTQQHLSNSKRKELKKQLRKQQANERKRQQAGIESDEQSSSPSDDTEVIIVKDIGCLSI
ncbi:OTU domain-containing protein 3-like isoform X2 [Macrobrachium nipponense]